MFRQLIALVMIGFVMSLSHIPAALAHPAESQSEKDAERTKKVKKLIQEVGVGPTRELEVTLKDKTQVKGSISEITDDHFVLTEKGTGLRTNVPYDQVEKVGKWSLVKTGIRKELSSPSRIFKKLAIGAGIAIGVALTACVVSKGCRN